MKKVLFVAVFAALGLTGAHAQGFKAGFNAGYPMGDAGDLYSVQMGADVSYTWEIADSFNAGVASGYGRFLGADINTAVGSIAVASFAYIPVAAVGSYEIGERWLLGVDVGYAVNTGEGGSGGFLYQPEFGYQGERFGVYAFYKGISVNSSSISSVGVGLGWQF